MEFLKNIFHPKVPQSKHGKFLVFFFGEIISSILITCDYRAIAIISYGWTFVINSIFFTMNWWFLKAILKADKDEENFWMGLGYFLGGVSGAELGLWLTVHLYGR